MSTAIDLGRLTADAKVARLLAEAAAAAVADDGACNLDSTFFKLGKGQRAGPVKKALEAGGLHVCVTTWLGRGLMLSAPGAVGQARKTSAAAEALYQSLSRSGWPVSPYYQMD